MPDPRVDEAAETTEASPSNRRKNVVLGGILMGVMLVEGLAVFVLAKSFGPGPQSAQAAGMSGLDAEQGQVKQKEVEVELVRFRAQNEKAERPVIYEFVVYATVSEKDQEAFKGLVERRQATIQDRLSSVVRAADPRRFAEPDLATLRAQFKHELSALAGNRDMVRELLIPSIVPFTGY